MPMVQPKNCTPHMHIVVYELLTTTTLDYIGHIKESIKKTVCLWGMITTLQQCNV